MPSRHAQEDPGREARVLLPFRLDLPRTLAVFRYGSGDPAYAVHGRGIWRALGTPAGDATLCSTVEGDALSARVWGAGSEWVLDHLRPLHGLDDDPGGFQPAHPVLRELQHRFAGVRFARTDLVMESLVPAVLSQKITGKEAFASWRRLLRRFGAQAPGPTPRPMRIPPSAPVLRTLADAHWHRLGVDHAHRSRVRRVAARASSIEALSRRPPGEAAQALQSVQGIGIWTAAEVAERAWGSPDHPSFGDYHVPSSVGVALIGEPVDDEGMARLLQEYRPHRGRVVRLIELGGIAKPRRGPRRSVPDYRDR